jgi:uncharacterized membrane protein
LVFQSGAATVTAMLSVAALSVASMLPSAALRNAGETVYQVLAHHGRGMAWNTMLALIPLVLASRLFRSAHASSSARTPSWWIGVGVFVLFLPNSPYVLSDVIHFFDDVRHTTDAHNLRVMFGVLPVYGAFMTIGFGAYVASLHLVRRFVTSVASSRIASGAIVALHACSSVGIFLGRFWRFNSWDVVTDPNSVAYRLDDLTDRWPVFMIALTFITLIACTSVVNLLIDGVRYRRTRAALV